VLSRKASKKSFSRRPFAVVTRAGSGTGYELARQFAVQGYDLLIVDEEKGIDRAKQQLEKLGSEVESYKLDLASTKNVELLHRKIMASGRPVDALAVNAAVGIGEDLPQDISLETEIHLIQVNLAATVHLSRLLVRQMVERKKGKILFTSSLMPSNSRRFESIYTASKVFLHSFAGSLREELEGSGVTVSSLLPDASETSLFQRTGVAAHQGYDALLSGKDLIIARSLVGMILGTILNFVPRKAASVFQRLQLNGSSVFSH